MFTFVHMGCKVSRHKVLQSPSFLLFNPIQCMDDAIFVKSKKPLKHKIPKMINVQTQ